MERSLQEERRAELLSLWKSNPHRVLSLYRELANLDELAPLPAGTTFTHLIDVILEKAASDSSLSLHP